MPEVELHGLRVDSKGSQGPSGPRAVDWGPGATHGKDEVMREAASHTQCQFVELSIGDFFLFFPANEFGVASGYVKRSADSATPAGGGEVTPFKSEDLVWKEASVGENYGLC